MPAEENIKTNPGIISRVFGALGKMLFFAFILLVAVLAVFILMSKLNNSTPSFFGYQVYNVLSHSMSGNNADSFDRGSLVLVRSINPGEIKEGDVITFNRSSGDSKLTTHRVVAVNRSENGELSFTTRGDTNPVSDGTPVPAGLILGKVVGSVPSLGYAVSFAQTKTGVILFVFIPVGLVVVYEAFFAISVSLRGKRRKNNSKASKPDMA